MTFPLYPLIGDRFTADNGLQFEWTDKGTWKSIVGERSTVQIEYTSSPFPPINPGIGDQWYDTLSLQLRTWTTNGSYSYWRAINASTVYDGDNSNPLIAERVLPLMWNYGEQNFAFEAWKDDVQYNWRDFTSTPIVKATSGDDTIEVVSTTGLVVGERYAVVNATTNVTQAILDVSVVLTDKLFRTRVSFGLNLGTGATKLVRTNFAVQDGFATVKSGDVYFSRPLRNLKNNLRSYLRVRRSAEGLGVFTVQQRTPGTSVWLPTKLINVVTPFAGYRDEVYSVDPGGPVEFAISYNDPSGRGDRIEHFALYPTPQAVDNKRVDQPYNISPANQSVNVSTTNLTLTGSPFRSLYSLPQNGAEFQIAVDDAFTNLVLNTSTDFFASWVGSTGLGGTVQDVDFQDGLNLLAVANNGRVTRSVDGGRTLTVATIAGGNPGLTGVAAAGTLAIVVGTGGTIQYSTDSGASWAAITPAGGYTDVFYGVAIADKYAILVGNNGEIQRTVNNRGLIYAKAPPDNGYTGGFSEVTLLSGGRAIAVGTGGEIQTSADYGATWRKRTPFNNYSGLWWGVHMTASGRAIAVGGGGEIQTSDDYGATWIKRTAANNYTGSFRHVEMSDNNAIAVGTGGEIQTSADYGTTWTKRTTPNASVADLLTVAFTNAGDYAVLMGVGVQHRPMKLEGAVTSYAVPNGALTLSNVYYWRVRYQDSAGFWSEYSKPTVFSTRNTINTVNAPVNLAPAKEALNISVVPTFQASEFSVIGDNDTHNGSQWQISNGTTFSESTLFYDSNTVAGATTHTLPLASKLVDKQTYSWRVRYRGLNDGFGPWSVSTSFTVTAKATRPTITNVSENGVRAILLQVTAFASPIAGDTFSASKYEVSTSATFEANDFVRSGTVAAKGTSNLELPQNVNALSTAQSFYPDTQYYFRVAHKGVQSEFSDWSDVVSYRTSKLPVIGEAVYTEPGTYEFTVPEGVTSICALVVGAGGGSATSNGGTYALPNTGRSAGGGEPGGGGGLTWKNNISVTAGQKISVVVGAGGLPGDYLDVNASKSAYRLAWDKTRGGSSSIGNVISATGGRTSTYADYDVTWWLNTEGRGGTAYGGDGGGNGGQITSNSTRIQKNGVRGGGGGGAGGYTGDGGTGGTVQEDGTSSAFAGTGGGGGGGCHSLQGYQGSAGGGGVGLYGQGPSGAGGQPSGSNQGSAGRGGSGGDDGGYVIANPIGAPGGVYGGGAGHSTDNVAKTKPRQGAHGAARIIWGPGRSFPNNAK